MIEHLKAEDPSCAFNVIDGNVIVIGPGLPAIGKPASNYAPSDLEAAVEAGLLVRNIRRIADTHGIDRGNQTVFVLKS